VTEYREHRCVFFEHVRLELVHSLVSRNAGEMLQQAACDAPSPPGVCDREAYLRRAAERRVATFADDEFVASAWHGGDESHVAPVADFVEPMQVVFGQTRLRAKKRVRIV
jgi:hypothetical protein